MVSSNIQNANLWATELRRRQMMGAKPFMVRKALWFGWLGGTNCSLPLNYRIDSAVGQLESDSGDCKKKLPVVLFLTGGMERLCLRR